MLLHMVRRGVRLLRRRRLLAVSTDELLLVSLSQSFGAAEIRCPDSGRVVAHRDDRLGSGHRIAAVDHV